MGRGKIAQRSNSSHRYKAPRPRGCGGRQEIWCGHQYDRLPHGDDQGQLPGSVSGCSKFEIRLQLGRFRLERRIAAREDGF